MELFVKNWRCIEEVKINLNTITLLIGRNSTGKSSLAYAPYFLVKLTKWKNTNEVLQYLYGINLEDVLRRDQDEVCYPGIIEVEGCRFEADGETVNIPDESPWKNAYLLPSIRTTLIKFSQFFARHEFEEFKKVIEKAILLFIEGLFKVIKTILLPPPTFFFFEDLMELYGIKVEARDRRQISQLGVLIEQISPMSHISYWYEDIYTKLKLPLHLAPDGFIDSFLISLIEKTKNKSLVVIEEPEIHKNPIQIIELAKNIINMALEKDLTVIMTTHSDILLHAIAKAVEEKEIENNRVSVYYLIRNKEDLWTKVKELKIYDDGTFDEIPDAEEVISKLF